MTKFKASILGMLCVLVLASANALWAQEAAEEFDEYVEEGGGVTVSFGVKAGATAAWFNNDDVTTKRLGPAVGAFLAIDFGGPIGIQVEGLYSRKGYTNDERTVTLDYFEFPILATLKLPSLGQLQPRLLSGPSFARRIGDSSYGSGVDKTEALFRNDLTGGDISWVFAASVDVPLRRGSLVIEGRYVLGLERIVDDQSMYAGGHDKNRALIGMVGYRF
jgi:hypothetical protein